MRRISREAGIGVVVSGLGVGAMAIDHPIGTEEDPGDDSGLAGVKERGGESRRQRSRSVCS
jgi:hypothetical protein